MNLTGLLDLPKIVVDDFEIVDGVYHIDCYQENDSAACPLCHQSSTVVVSRYSRTIQDLPIAGHTVWPVLELRRFVCQNSDCTERIFVQPVVFASGYAHRTMRLDNLVLYTVAEQSSTATARLLGSMGVVIRHTAIYVLLKKQF